MATPVELPPDYPLIHARETLLRGLSIEGHLLSAGERGIAEIWLNLPPDCAHAHARLLSRRRQPVRVEGFAPPGVDDIDGVLGDLRNHGLIDLDDDLSIARRVDVMTVAELAAACRELGFSTRGKRADLIERVRCQAFSTVPRAIEVRHRGLFTRLFRAGLQDHSGDLTKVVLSELGHRQSAEYALTGGSGRWTSRGAMLGYEEALASRQIMAGADVSVEQVDLAVRAAVESLATSPVVGGLQWRFSAARQALFGVLSLLRRAERDDKFSPDGLADWYRKVLDSGMPDRVGPAHRFALLLDRAERGHEALEVCERYAGGDAESLALQRTAHRIAKRVGSSTDLEPVPRVRPDRVVELQAHSTSGRWTAEDGRGCRVEEAVVSLLQGVGRDAFHGENTFWTSLFALLYEPVFFAPVAGMWPAPLMTKPMDLGYPQFAAARAREIEFHHETLAKVGIRTWLEDAWRRRYGQRIAGVDWRTFTVDQLTSVAEDIGLEKVKAVLRPFLTNWRDASRGLPDIVVCGGSAVEVARAPLTERPMLIEVKGPTDTLRDAQRWWIGYLKAAGIDVEVWRIEASGGKADQQEAV